LADQYILPGIIGIIIAIAIGFAITILVLRKRP
jgi:anaerobic C4-dicarboxylate transporter